MKITNFIPSQYVIILYQQNKAVTTNAEFNGESSNYQKVDTLIRATDIIEI